MNGVPVIKTNNVKTLQKPRDLSAQNDKGFISYMQFYLVAYRSMLSTAKIILWWGRVTVHCSV